LHGGEGLVAIMGALRAESERLALTSWPLSGGAERGQNGFQVDCGVNFR
jgi:hypothetical protein